MSVEQADDDNSFFVNSDGLKIYCKYWYPQQSGDPGGLRGVVFICHGAGEHCQVQPYSKLALKLSECNMLVFSHDHVGHGLSEGERMQISDFNIYCNDVIQHVNVVRNKHQNIPFFIVGSSMGGAIATKIVLDNSSMFAGMALIAPAFIICPRWLTTSSVANYIARKFSRVFPQFQLSGLDPNDMSHDPETVKSYAEDPLVWHGGIKAKWLMCFLDLTAELRSRFTEITCPYLALQGSADKVCDPAGVQMFHDNSSSANKRLKMFPGAYHQVHAESDGRGDEALSDIVQWITDQLSS